MRSTSNLKEFFQCMRQAIRDKKDLPQGFKLDLNHKKISDKTLKLITPQITTGRFLEGAKLRLLGFELSLICSNINIEGVRVLTSALKMRLCPRGFSIDLSGNQIGDEVASEFSERLTNGDCPKFFSLDLSENSLTEDGVDSLAAAIKSGKCPFNFQLTLRKNMIYREAVELLANAIASGNYPEYFYLNLDYNHLSGQSITALTNALRSVHCTRPISLSIAFNWFGREGIIPIADLLASGLSPKNLFLSLRGTFDKHACLPILGNSLESGKWPQNLQLTLGWNDINDEQATEFINSLEKTITNLRCPQGLMVDLTGNKISEPLLERISALLKLNELKYIAFACMILYKTSAKNQSSSIVGRLPLDIIENCCSYLAPFAPNEEKQRSSFYNKIQRKFMEWNPIREAANNSNRSSNNSSASRDNKENSNSENTNSSNSRKRKLGLEYKNDEITQPAKKTNTQEASASLTPSLDRSANRKK